MIIKRLFEWWKNRRPKCKGCKQRIDPDVCHCGDPLKAHGWASNHPVVPMGCICGYEPHDGPQKKFWFSKRKRKPFTGLRPF